MRTSILGLLSLLAPVVALAQSGLPPLTVQVEVKVINVDVTVTDSAGRPVKGLTKGDFEIYEDGVPQTVTNFYVIDDQAQPQAAPGSAEKVESPVPAQFKRKIALLIDNNYIEKAQRDAALRTIDKFIDEGFDGRYEWAVAVIGNRVEMLQSFTNDKVSIHRAIGAARKTPAFPFHSEMNRAILSDPDRRKEESTLTNLTGTYAENFKSAARFQAREQTYRALRAVTGTARAVAETAHAYAAEDGRRIIVLLTGGMEMNTTFEAYDSGFDKEIQQTKLLIAKTIDEMVREANAANFTIEIVNARTRGMIAPQHDVENRSAGLPPNLFLSGGGNEPIDTTDRDSSSLTIAEGTGGGYFTSNSVRQSLETIDVQTATYYSIGYKPPHEDDRQFHSIKVKVKRSGVRVAHRAGYVDLSPEDRLQEFLRARLSTAAAAGGSLPVQVEVGQVVPRDRGESAVPLTAAIPMERVTVIPSEGQLAGRVHVYVSVFDAEGNNVAFDHHLQEVRLSAEEYENAGLFRYTMRVRLRKGAFKVLVTLRDELSNEIGSAVQSVQL